MEAIVSDFESIEKGRKRKTAEAILSPTLKVDLKKSKKGPSPRKKTATKMAVKMEQLKRGQEELIKKSQANHEKLFEMMQKLSTKQEEASDMANKRTQTWSLKGWIH